jgi:hypothetical protein
LVLVNDAGNWVGELVGAPGSNMEGSSGTTFSVGADGQVTASNGANNSGNGAGSNNTTNSTSSSNTNTTQNNTANITNTLNLSANTGGNTANDNTGGNSTINTGNANIVADLVNFVNNNIVGNGHLVVTLVNVFGSWMGDFVGPGQSAPTTTTPNVASADSSTSSSSSNSSSSNGSNSSSSNNSNSSSSNTPTPTPSSTTEVSVSSTSAGYYFGSNHEVVYTNGKKGKKIADANHGSVLGTKTAFLGTQDSKKTIVLNLAWLILVLPLLVMGVVGRRILKKRFVK